MTEAPKILLAHHLKTLKLPTFLREYDKLARQCAAEGHGVILPQWSTMASKNGYAIAGRIADRLHLALRCDACGGLTKTALFVLINAQPTTGDWMNDRLTEASGVLTLVRS